MAAQPSAHGVPSSPGSGLDTEGHPLGHNTSKVRSLDTEDRRGSSSSSRQADPRRFNPGRGISISGAGGSRKAMGSSLRVSMTAQQASRAIPEEVQSPRGPALFILVRGDAVTLSSLRGVPPGSAGTQVTTLSAEGSDPQRHGKFAGKASLAQGTWVGACAAARKPTPGQRKQAATQACPGHVPHPCGLASMDLRLSTTELFAEFHGKNPDGRRRVGGLPKAISKTGLRVDCSYPGHHVPRHR